MNMTTEANKKKKRRHLKKKRLWLPITIIVLLIVARLLLPYFVKNYVNKTLANIPGYYGQVEEILHFGVVHMLFTVYT